MCFTCYFFFFLKNNKTTTTPKQTKTKQCFITSCVCCFFCLLHFSGSECCNKETQAEACKRSAFLPYLIVRIKTLKIWRKKATTTKKKAKTIGCWRWVKHSTIFISVRNFVTRKNHTLPPTLLFKHHKNPSCLSIIHRAGLTKWFQCLSKKKGKKRAKVVLRNDRGLAQEFTILRFGGGGTITQHARCRDEVK